MTPFQALYGCVPPHVVRIGNQQTPVDSLDQFLLERDVTLGELQFNIMKAQKRMKHYADKKRRDVTYEVGDLLYLKIRSYKQKTIARLINEKMGLRYYGPYKINHKIRQVAYKLDLPKESLVSRKLKGCSNQLQLLLLYQLNWSF